jgi:hypothetical protein
LPFPLDACKTCYEIAKKATYLFRWSFPPEYSFVSEDPRYGKRPAKASPKAQLAITVGSKTLCATLQEVLDHNHHNINCVNLKNLPSRPEVFAVGDTVDVEARMGAGFNLPGGVATVLSRKTVDGGEVVYAVRCAISGGGEGDLPAALLSARTETVGRRASSSSPSAPSTSSDARRAVDAQHELDRTVGEMKKKLSVAHWEALQDRKEAAGLREKMRGHVKELSLLAAAVKVTNEEWVKVKLAQQACLEELHKNMDEIAAEAAAANDVTSKMAAKLKAVQVRLRQEEKVRKKAEGDAEATRNESDARQARVLANVGRLLDDQKQAAKEEHQGALQKHASTAAELKEKLEESQRPATNLVAAATRLGVPTEKRLTATTGGTASSCKTFSNKTLATVVRAAVSAIIKTLELASPLGDACDSAPAAAASAASLTARRAGWFHTSRRPH